MNGLSGAQIMPSIRWSLVKLPTREMPWVLPKELQAPPSFKPRTRLSHRPRTWACRDSRRGGIGKWYMVFPKFDWFLETSKTEMLVKKSDKT